MTMLAPTLFLGFMHNTLTGEHFIAPANASNPTEAESVLRETYPSAAYAVLTVYQAQAVQRYLTDVVRWPDLPSRVQPKLADLLATQQLQGRIRSQTTGLPAMPSQKTAPAPYLPAGLTAAQVMQVKTIAQGMPLETQTLAARLLAGGVAAQRSPMRQPLSQTGSQAGNQHIAAPSVPPLARTPGAPLQARIETSNTPAPNGGNLKEALAAMRAFNTPSQPSVYGHTEKPSVRVVQRLPMTSNQLPASARGVAQEDTAPASPPTAFAVGKVSAISILKALRQA